MVSVLPDEGDTPGPPSEGEGADAGREAGAAIPTEPSLDVVFDVLRNSRRRHVLQRLASLDGATTLGDFAEHIGGIENDKPPSALSSQERKRVYVGLYQSHLPKMSDAGAIRYDDRGTVEPGPHFDVFRKYMDRPAPGRTPPPGYTVGVVAASILGVLVTFATSELVAAVIIAVMIGLVGLVGARVSS